MIAPPPPQSEGPGAPDAAVAEPWVPMRLGADLSFLAALDDAVVIVDAAARIVYFNRAAERSFGYRADEVLGGPLDMLVPEGHRGAHRGKVDGFRTSDRSSRMMKERSDILARHRDGSLFHAEALISKFEVGGALRMMAILRDVTWRRMAEARVRQSEQKHRAVLETCSDAILIADAGSGLIVEVNERAAELFGCRVRDLIGLHQSALHPPEDRDRFRQTFRDHLETGRVLVRDGRIQRRDGTVVPVEICARPTEIDGVPMLVGYFRDITYRELRERALVAAREEARAANHSKSMVLANISHELRTPLNAVIAMSEMICGEFFGPLGSGKYREYARDIHASGEHLLELINDFLDLSRIEAGKLSLQEEEVDLDALIRQCRRTVARQLQAGGIDCRLPARRPPALRADRRAVRQMLLNLLSNAIKHTPAGGCIRILAEPAAEGGLGLGVSDTGIGIPPERLAVVTQPFNAVEDTSVRREGGTGLGLAITKGLIECHGGTLQIRSERGAGTTVTLHFPAGRIARPARERGENESGGGPWPGLAAAGAQAPPLSPAR